MLRGFLEEGHTLFIGERGRRVIGQIAELLEKNEGVPVFFLSDQHDPWDEEFKNFPPHCLKGSTEAEIVPELKGYPGEVIPKKHFSGFYQTGLDEKLKTLGIEKLIISGVLTDICVLHTAADACRYGYRVEVPANCVFSPDPAAHQFALKHLSGVLGVKVSGLEEKKFTPAPQVLSGETADIYFLRTLEILKKEKLNPVATMQVFSGRLGILCGIKEAVALLEEVIPPQGEVWALEEGDEIGLGEVVLRVKAPYQSYAVYETAILGILAHSSGWATAARECVLVAQGIPVISFGARHVHPNVAAIMDYASVTGGCQGCSSVLGARLACVEPSGTMPHALILVFGDTVLATLAFDRHMPPGVPRISLVDTFKDEAEESLRVAHALKERLTSVRLDTPTERGGVTPALVKEVRARLDLEGFNHVGIFVSGGVNPERIRRFIESGAPVSGFGVGSYITAAPPIDFTADLHEIEGKPIAKRGRIPGVTPNPRLKRVL